MNKEYIGKTAIINDVLSYAYSEIVEINAQDSSGIYYEYDDKQFIIYYHEISDENILFLSPEELVEIESWL